MEGTPYGNLCISFCFVKAQCCHAPVGPLLKAFFSNLDKKYVLLWEGGGWQTDVTPKVSPFLSRHFLDHPILHTIPSCFNPLSPPKTRNQCSEIKFRRLPLSLPLSKFKTGYEISPSGRLLYLSLLGPFRRPQRDPPLPSPPLPVALRQDHKGGGLFPTIVRHGRKATFNFKDSLGN